MSQVIPIQARSTQFPKYNQNRKHKMKKHRQYD